jgi:hypothetical protein
MAEQILLHRFGMLKSNASFSGEISIYCGNECALEPIEVTACQYGGEYPHCESAPTGGSAPSNPYPDPMGPLDPGTGGGGYSPPGDTNYNADSHDGGPMLWAACIIVVGGSVAAVYTTALEFQEWHYASGELSSINRILEGSLSHDQRVFWQERQRDAEHEYKRAKANVGYLTGASAGALATAIATCSPSLLIPTP